MNGDTQRSALARSFATSNVRDNRDILAPASSIQRRATPLTSQKAGSDPMQKAEATPRRAGSDPWLEPQGRGRQVNLAPNAALFAALLENLPTRRRSNGCRLPRSRKRGAIGTARSQHVHEMSKVLENNSPGPLFCECTKCCPRSTNMRGIEF